MNFDPEKIRNFSSWLPDEKAISWTKNHIKNGFKKSIQRNFIWVTSSYSIEFSNTNKNAVFSDVNFDMKTNPKSVFEDVSRVIKVLEKLGYTIIFPENKMVLNLSQETRLIGEQLIDKNQFIPQSTY